MIFLLLEPDFGFAQEPPENRRYRGEFLPKYVEFFGLPKQVDEDQALWFYIIDVESSSKLTASWLNKFMNVYVYVYTSYKRWITSKLWHFTRR